MSVDDVMDISQFKSIRLKISVLNTTTRSEVRNTSKVHLVELLERGMVLEVPRQCCDKGHYLVLHVEPTGLPPEKREKALKMFMTGAKVEKRESASPTSDRIVVSLLQHDPGTWQALCELFSSRQEEIEQFFKAAKG